MKESLMTRKSLSLILIFLVNIFCYINSIHNEFTYDDYHAIQKNKIVIGEKKWTEVWTSDYFGNSFGKWNIQTYRPISLLSFKVNYLFGKLNPTSYHLLNIFFHILASFLLFYLSFLIVFKKNLMLALAISLLFSVHAIHTENVTSIVGRADIIGCLFFLLSFISYNNYLTLDKFKFFLLTVFFAFLALLSKENAVSVLGVCFFFDLWIKNPHIFKKILRKKINFSNLSSKEKYFLKRLFLLSFFSLSFIFFRFALIPFDPGSVLFAEWMNPVAFSQDFLTRFLTKAYLSSYHFYLLVFPYKLSHNWQFESIPLIKSFYDFRNLSTLFFFSFLFFCFYLSFSKRVSQFYRKKLKLSLLFLIIPFIPVSGLFFDVGFVLAERVLYIPSLGFCLLFCTFFYFLHEKFERRKSLNKLFLLKVTFILILFSQMLRTIERNEDWKNDETLVKSAYKVVPQNSSVQHGLAVIAMTRSNKEKGRELFQKVLKSKYYTKDRYFNLGIFLRDEGKEDEALKMFKKEIKISELDIAYLQVSKIYTLQNIELRFLEKFRKI